MRRREFIAGLGGVAAAQLAARAQDRERVRRIGVMMTLTTDDPEGLARAAAFAQGLQEIGWIVGRNLRIDYRWSTPDQRVQSAAQLVALAPEVILAATSLSVAAVQQHTRTIPIVFVQVIDPVSGGFVASLSRPGGNVTGFLSFEYSIGGKWLQLLKDMAPVWSKNGDCKKDGELSVPGVASRGGAGYDFLGQSNRESAGVVIIRLIQKWLKAGILEDGVVSVSDRGTGQGSVISPLLANIYLHYALDLWAARWRQRVATGDMIIVRYADDFIVGFQHDEDGRFFLEQMRERLGKFALSLHPEKTRLIEFGRFAAERRKRQGLGKPETFNFLGFTFICGKTRAGKFQIKRKTRGDRMRAKLKEIKQEMRRRMHQPIPEQGRWLGRAHAAGRPSGVTAGSGPVPRTSALPP